jgi:mercuric ion transport protein
MRGAGQQMTETSDVRGEASERTRRTGWLAAGGIVGALLASTCCIVPLVLVTIGVSGAWIGNLTALEPFKPFFIVATLIMLGLGFRQVYFRPKVACDCATPRSSIVTQTALWVATALVALALTIDWWAPIFY